MKNIKLFITAILIAAPAYLYAQEDNGEILPRKETPELEQADADYTTVDNSGELLDPGFTVDQKEAIISGNERFWKGNNKIFSVGFSTGWFDFGKYNGGKLDSRWGASLKFGRYFNLHPKPIAHIVKFNLFFGTDITYLNFEKGHGSIKDMLGNNDDYYDDDWNDYYPDEPEQSATLGTHYLNIGLGIGPAATLMPFYWCANPNVARIKLRPYFLVVPAFSALIVSNDDETEFHNAFGCFFAGGFEITWRKLSVGFEWKGGRARYKGLSDMLGDYYDEVPDNIWVGNESTKKPRYGCKMFTVSLGVTF